MRLRRVTAAAAVALVAWSAVAPSVSADPITDKKRQAAQLADQLERLRTRAEVLAEQYDKVVVELQNLATAVTQARNDLNRHKAEISLARSQLGDWALRSYIHSGATDPLLSALTGANQAGDIALRQSYVQLAVGSDQRSADELRRATLDSQAIQSDLDAKVQAQAKLAAQLEATRIQVEKATSDAQAVLGHTQGQLRQLLLEEQQRRLAALEAATRARLARPSTAGIEHVVRQPPPSSPGAQGAVAAALSMLGTRYLWAGASPASGFDCSGLVMWAWARAGRPGLPHNAYAQYMSLPHVNISDLQPGDLVFFGRDIHHVGMYIGNGQMVHSPQTGDVVRVMSVYQGDLVGAARP